MSEDREKQDRWRALAEELGLPPEPPGDKPAPPAPTPPAEVTTPAVAAPTPEPAPPPPPEIVEKPMPLFDAEPACVPAGSASNRGIGFLTISGSVVALVTASVPRRQELSPRQEALARAGGAGLSPGGSGGGPSSIARARQRLAFLDLRS